jgi:hypothetical protein
MQQIILTCHASKKGFRASNSLNHINISRSVIMDDVSWVPIILFIVTGMCTVAFFHFNNKNRSAVMDTVQKSMETGSDLTPDLLAKLGAAINPKFRDMRRGVVLLSVGIGGVLCSMFFTDVDVVSGIRAGSMFPIMMGVGFLLVWKLNKD